ncbi:MAG: hypothetical protein ACLFNQ_00005, partial [Spirochaetaceae bacterium]
MAVSFQVEIENSHFVPFLKASPNAGGSLKVTPMHPDQTRALVNVAAVRGSRIHPVHSFDARDLPLRTDRPVVMQLTGRVLGYTRLRLRLHVDGAPRGEVTVPVGRYILLPLFVRSIVAALLVLALVVGGVSGVRRFG